MLSLSIISHRARINTYVSHPDREWLISVQQHSDITGSQISDMLLDNSASIARCPSCSRSKAIGAVRCRLYCRYYGMICKDIDSGVQMYSSFVNGKYRPRLCWVFPALSPRVHDDIFLPTSVDSSSWRCRKRPGFRVLNGLLSIINRRYIYRGYRYYRTRRNRPLCRWIKCDVVHLSVVIWRNSCCNPSMLFPDYKISATRLLTLINRLRDTPKHQLNI